MEWSCWHPLATIYDQDPVITVRLSDLLLIGRRTSRLLFSEPSSAGHPRHQRPIDFQQRQECLVLLPLPYLFFFTGAVSYSSSFLKIIRVVIIAHVDYGPQGTKFRRTDRPERNLFRRPLNWKCRRLQNICGKKNGIPNNRATSWITRNTTPSPKLFLEIKKMNTNSLSTKNSPKNLKSNVLCIILVIRYF